MAIGPMTPPVKSWDNRKKKKAPKDQKRPEDDKKQKFDELILSVKTGATIPDDVILKQVNDHSYNTQARIYYRV